jgi:hypothetical protein
MTLFTSFTGLPAKIPPPWSVMPELPLTAFRETMLRVKVNGPPGGPLGTAASKMPPPWALPLSPLASPVFPLTVVLRSVIPKSPAMRPPPVTNAFPLGLETLTWLPLTTLSDIEPEKIAAPPPAFALPAADLTVTVLPVKRVLPIAPAISPAPESPWALPEEPGSVSALTLLSAMTSLLSSKSTPRRSTRWARSRRRMRRWSAPSRRRG